MDASLDEALLARFEAGFRSHRPAGKLGLAVSGGADSMALLALASGAFGDLIEVASVNHGLRPEAADECALVRHECEARGIPCAILEIEVGEGNLQDRARAARYAALGAWANGRGLAAIATAHHADDQAETLMMRLNRGSGLSGLAGIRPAATIEGCEVPVIRPLLRFRREELRQIVEQAGLPFVEDPSNRDESFDRVRMRRHLEQADWIDPLALARSAAYLEEAENTLQSIADQVWRREASVTQARVAVPQTDWLDTGSRLVERAIASLGGQVARGEVAAFLEKLDKRGNIGGVMIEKSGEFYICTREPPRRTR